MPDLPSLALLHPFAVTSDRASMSTNVPPTLTRARVAAQPVESLCQHRQNCQCHRPQLGRAIVVVVVLQLVMACVTIATGATAVGLVACIAIGGCGWLAAVAEVIAYYRIGLGTTTVTKPGTVRPSAFRANQM